MNNLDELKATRDKLRRRIDQADTDKDIDAFFELCALWIDAYKAVRLEEAKAPAVNLRAH